MTAKVSKTRKPKAENVEGETHISNVWELIFNLAKHPLSIITVGFITFFFVIFFSVDFSIDKDGWHISKKSQLRQISYMTRSGIPVKTSVGKTE